MGDVHSDHRGVPDAVRIPQRVRARGDVDLLPDLVLPPVDARCQESIFAHLGHISERSYSDGTGSSKHRQRCGAGCCKKRVGTLSHRWEGAQSLAAKLLDGDSSSDLVCGIFLDGCPVCACSRGPAEAGLHILDSRRDTVVGIRSDGPRHWDYSRWVLGVRNTWMGRLLGMGPRGELFAYSLVALRGFDSHNAHAAEEWLLRQNKLHSQSPNLHHRSLQHFPHTQRRSRRHFSTLIRRPGYVGVLASADLHIRVCIDRLRVAVRPDERDAQGSR